MSKFPSKHIIMNVNDRKPSLLGGSYDPLELPFVTDKSSMLLLHHTQKQIKLYQCRGTGGKLIGGASWCLRYKITTRGRKTVKKEVYE